MNNLNNLEKTLGIVFQNKDLALQAVVHRSYLNEHPGFHLGHNERLEFLGDAVLEIIVTEYLYHQFPEREEGDLTDWRASLVNAKMLAQIAQEIHLEKYLLLSRGEAKDNQSKARQYILANAVEAVIGALYLDQGTPAAKKFIDQYILSKLKEILDKELYVDPKSKLQERAQELHGITPHYTVLEESGPDHDKLFEVGVYLADELIASGNGSSKHEAQMTAAANALKIKNW